jgi:histidinol-phosphate/aromatic aminotransferase/cobyric acid decarboxylase-like protein/GNAT superfamily N-acetyltransferase
MLATLPMRARIRIADAKCDDRDAIYRLRHDVYARELGQHPENPAGRLTDGLDAFNHYIVAWQGGEIAGFVSITPPGHERYSIDKYLARDDLPFALDDGVYEVRLLTVAAAHRGRPIAGLLMYAALRWIEARGGSRIVAIGRREVLDMYRKVGMESLGHEVRCGAVRFELMTATTAALRQGLARYAQALRKVEPGIDWQLGVPLYPPAGCYHGGAFWDAIGDEFNTLQRSSEVINADVLDAWFPPAPGVIDAIKRHIEFLLRTSPPTGCEGMIRTLARVRGVDPASILPGDGSSRLIFQAFRHWLRPSSRVLMLDPTYGEYAHVLEQVVRCRVDRLPLERSRGYELDLTRLEARFANGYDLIVLVNPNSPTGRLVPRADLQRVLAGAPPRTRVWIDETYVEYAGPEQSLERFAAQSSNIVVAKSMSKVYALSGVRAAYLCAAPQLVEELRAITPPWAVSLPAQVAAVEALRIPEYYAARYQETHRLREELVAELAAKARLEFVPSVANFVLGHLPPDGPDAATVCRRCRAEGVYLRDVSNMGRRLGAHALRIAVKDRQANRRIIATLTRALRA